MPCGRTGRRRKGRKSHRLYDQLHCEQKHLIQWSIKCGLIMAHLTPKKFDETGRGLLASKDLNLGDRLFAVPIDLIITYDKALEFATRMLSENVANLLSGKELFVLFLLSEARLDIASFYHSYLQMLPRQYSTLPYLQPEEIHAIPDIIYVQLQEQISEIGTCIEAYRRCAESGAVIDRNLLSVLKGTTFEDVRWAYSVLNTRSVYLKSLKKGETSRSRRSIDYALIPVFDLLNHKPVAKVCCPYFILSTYDCCFVCGCVTFRKQCAKFCFVKPTMPIGI